MMGAEEGMFDDTCITQNKLPAGASSVVSATTGIGDLWRVKGAANNLFRSKEQTYRSSVCNELFTSAVSGS